MEARDWVSRLVLDNDISAGDRDRDVVALERMFGCRNGVVGLSGKAMTLVDLKFGRDGTLPRHGWR